MDGLVYILIIGLVAGFLAVKITKGSGFGIIGDIIVGVFGALVGGFVFSLFGLVFWGVLGNLLTATVGAVIFLSLVRFIKRA